MDWDNKVLGKRRRRRNDLKKKSQFEIERRGQNNSCLADKAVERVAWKGERKI